MEGVQLILLWMELQSGECQSVAMTLRVSSMIKMKSLAECK